MLDPFSDLLSLMSARSIISGGLVAGGAWAINFPRADTIKFWGVVRGSAWQLQELAHAAAMSRASFAAYFKKVAGMSPLLYLTRWRMHLAQRALLQSRMHINVLARSLGYTSESAFSNAFRRVVGRSPKDFRMQASKEITIEQ